MSVRCINHGEIQEAIPAGRDSSDKQTRKGRSIMRGKRITPALTILIMLALGLSAYSTDKDAALLCGV